MTNQEKAREIEKAVKGLTGSASAYRHGRWGTGGAKLAGALNILQRVECSRD